jgi:CheY-like chemotaxis protein
MIEIELVLADDLSPINADPTQVEQVLMNLAVNARDAMPDGGKLSIRTENVTLDAHYAKTHLGAKPGPFVLLSVSDTGKGMDKETVQHIFEPFFTTKRPGEGTGLGLAMVYGIVKQHGGHIMCYSELSQGTVFKIYFPALVRDEKPTESEPRPLPRGGSETILLVDDEELVRDLGVRILTKAGYTVITASDGKRALELYEANRQEISLVILDLIMPHMGGKKCLDELLSLDPAVKVVIASGYSADAPTKEALRSGAKGFVHKPYDIRQVLDVVREVLDKEKDQT